MIDDHTHAKNLSENPSHSTNLDRFRFAVFCVSFYIYVAGALYFYGWMDTLGFKGASLDSIFSPLVYSRKFLLDIFSNASMQNDVLVKLLIWSTIITLLVAFFAMLRKYTRLKLVPSKTYINRVALRKFMKKNPVLTSLIIFPVSSLSYLVIFVIFISTLSFAATFLIAPYQMGTVSAKEWVNLNEGKICETIDWSSDEYSHNELVLSCERVVTSNGYTVVGSIVHTDQKYAYVITNDVLFRMQGRKIVSCVAKQHYKDEEISENSIDKSGINTCLSLLEPQNA